MTIEIIEGDCLRVMPTLPAGSIDMVLADLPYGTTRNAWDEVIPFEQMWEQFWRLCPAGAVVLTAAQPFASALVMSQPACFRYDWIWRKNKASGHLNAKKRPLVNHEHVLVFSRTAPPYTPQMTSGHKPGNYANRRTHSSNYGQQVSTEYGGSTERYPLSVLDFDVVNNISAERVHPTQKPVPLLEYLIKTYSRPGDTILSATCGSGSELVAADAAGRNAIGIELNPEYVAIARRRLGLNVEWDIFA